MANPVFSQGFIYYTGDGSPTSFEVPEGFTAVVRQCAATILVGASSVYFRVQESDEAPILTFAVAYEIGALQSWALECRVVCNAGGLITIFDSSEGTPSEVYVGGYLLRN